MRQRCALDMVEIPLNELGEETEHYKRQEQLDTEFGKLHHELHVPFSMDDEYFPFEPFLQLSGKRPHMLPTFQKGVCKSNFIFVLFSPFGVCMYSFPFFHLLFPDNKFHSFNKPHYVMSYIHDKSIRPTV